MALLFMDGWDKYGGANTNATSVVALLAGEWTTITNCNIGAPLSSTGQSLVSGGVMTLAKTLSSSIGRTIGGVRFSSSLGGNVGIQFQDAGTAQCGIVIATTGIISLRNGIWSTGTVIGSSASPVSANTTHYLEWDITLANSAAYTVYLDGVAVISGTGDTTATTNNTISGFQLLVAAGTGTFDDLYMFDTTGTANNAVLLTSPRIETTLPSNDSAVQFAIGASVLGSTVSRATGNIGFVANAFNVRPFTPARSCTLNSISLAGTTTSAGVNLRPIVYTDNAGAPNILMSAGATVTGITAGAIITMPLTTPQSLTAGTQYWLGYMADTASGAIGTADSAAQARLTTSTFASGAPGTAPATSTGNPSPLYWGNVTLASAANYYEVSQSPPPAANTSYLTDTNVGHEDLYGFPALSATPASVYAVAVKAFCSRSDTGARTVSLRMSSGGTDGGGSLTGQTPGTTYGWIGSNFPTDPNGSIAWTGTALNAATTGFKIDA